MIRVLSSTGIITATTTTLRRAQNNFLGRRQQQLNCATATSSCKRSVVHPPAISRRFISSTGSNDGDDSSNNNNNNNNNSKNASKTVLVKVESSNSNDGDDSSSSSSSTPTTTTTIVPIPQKLPFGEASPRMPHMTAIPIISRPLFPGLVTSITLTDEATIDALDQLTKQQETAYISCFLRAKYPSGVSDGGVVLSVPEVITDASEIYHTGTFAQIQRLTRGVPNPKPVDLTSGETTASAASAANASSSKEEDTAATLILLAHRRVNLVSVDDIGPPIDVTVNHWPRMEYTGTTPNNDSVRALSNEVISTIREVAQMNVLFRENLQLFPMRFDANDPFKLADFAASITASGTPEELQSVLEEKDPERRLHKALVLLIREREVSKLQKEISAKVEEKMTEAQRKYFLMEQLKSIKKELGMERDDKDALVEKFRKQLSEYTDVPTEVMETIESELEKFSALEKNSSEYNVTRSYLDSLISVPWGIHNAENFDIRSARTILDRDHYGLDDVKDTILQFIAIGKLKGTVQGRILCLAGPPGTGKTSIAKSVADALGRKFYRFSVGGLSDVSEIKGHRRTYVGAMPGKIIQCLKTTGTMNPVVLIDEIDKLGTGYRGDPASALLEVLDPSQNSSFRDYFLDVPVDISKVLFICTANQLENIPGPLLDRMEVIRLSGYDYPEKVAIAQQYLVPKSMKNSGLMEDPTELKANDKDTTISEDDKGTAEAPVLATEMESVAVEAAVEEQSSDITETKLTPVDMYVYTKGVPTTLSITIDAIKSLVRWYAREAGVRNLAKYIDKITGKLALQIVAEGEGATLTEKATRKIDSWVVTEDNLSYYVGKPVFTKDRLYEDAPLPTGIIMGLAYTSMGGTALYIETQAIRRGRNEEGKRRGGGSLKLTGQLGAVMQESAEIAYTVARARLADIDPTSSFFDEMDIHMHVPEGATPKDGPSAGITMTTSMLSLATGKPCSIDLAMTGEISLTGKVLPVGGIKEKIMAARRAAITKVVLPASNKRDYEEIAEYLKEGLSVHWAEDYSQVYEVAFGNDDQKDNLASSAVGLSQ